MIVFKEICLNEFDNPQKMYFLKRTLIEPTQPLVKHKKTVPIGTVVIYWYSVLSEYRANNIKEIDELYRLIESLSFQSQLEQVI